MQLFFGSMPVLHWFFSLWSLFLCFFVCRRIIPCVCCGTAFPEFRQLPVFCQRSRHICRCFLAMFSWVRECKEEKGAYSWIAGTAARSVSGLRRTSPPSHLPESPPPNHSKLKLPQNPRPRPIRLNPRNQRSQPESHPRNPPPPPQKSQPKSHRAPTEPKAQEEDWARLAAALQPDRHHFFSADALQRLLAKAPQAAGRPGAGTGGGGGAVAEMETPKRCHGFVGEEAHHVSLSEFLDFSHVCGVLSIFSGRPRVQTVFGPLRT